MRTGKAAVLLLLIVSATSLMAQYVPTPGEEPSPRGAITPQVIETLRGSVEMTPELRTLQNALAENEINSLVIDRRKTISDDTLFTKEVKTGKITNQAQSGRCWLFGGLNAIRPDVIKKYGMDNFELSQAYNQFWDKLERANRSLELAIALKSEPPDSRKNMLLLQKPIEDGGDWNFVKFLVNRYGVVPKSVMPDTQQAGQTSQMNGLLSTVMRKGIKSVREAATPEAEAAAKMETLKDVYKILVLCLGEPPVTFRWRYEDKNGGKDQGNVAAKNKDNETKGGSGPVPYRTFTPQSFYREFMGAPLDDFVSFINYPGKPMNSMIRFSWNRDSSDGPDMQALNVSTDQMKKIALASLMDDQVVWFCCNSSVQRNTKTGLWDMGIQDFNGLFGIDFTMSKEDQLRFFDGAPNHCMVFTGVDVQEGVPVKWKVENSWGDKRGRDGWWTITDPWFDANVYEILIDKKYCPPELLKAMGQEPLVMPPWDPFSN